MGMLRSNDVIEHVLKDLNAALSKHFEADVIFLKSEIRFGLDDRVKDEVESLKKSSDRRKLCVLIETPGGFIEVVERIYKVFRRHYETVIYVVPNYAYSAGTVLVLSGDEIYMDYYSVLGPIDPQLENDQGKMVPGLGILVKYHELLRTINSSSDGTAKAELAFLLKQFDPGTLFLLEEAQKHSQDLLEEWLPKHKFKNWEKTTTRGLAVDDEMKKARAKEIAAILGDPERWHSHGRGIGLSILTSEEIKLDINDFSEDDELNNKIQSYYRLFVDFCEKMGAINALHTPRGLRRIG